MISHCGATMGNHNISMYFAIYLFVKFMAENMQAGRKSLSISQKQNKHAHPSNTPARKVAPIRKVASARQSAPTRQKVNTHKAAFTSYTRKKTANLKIPFRAGSQ